jgi:meso-butanediol dehydrogenase / (S,S)-butanediol dehydrogenase / diacetyl reductase
MTSSHSVNSRVAVVTGAGRGIGAGIARRLAGDGARVVVADVDATSAADVARRINDAGGTAVGWAMDVTSADDRERIFHDARDTFGGVHVLVNNAGIYRAQPPLELEVSAWRRVFEVNAEAVFFCCQQALPIMREQGYGRIVNLSSTAAYTGTAAMIAYNASKSAVLAITRSLAREYGRDGITVNSVLPGVVATPMWESLNEEVGPLLGFAPGTLLADRVGRIPLGRAGEPEDIASVVSFLASDDAAYVTGQSLNVCGGLWMP